MKNKEEETREESIRIHNLLADVHQIGIQEGKLIEKERILEKLICLKKVYPNFIEWNVALDELKSQIEGEW